ncbi:hypothetical protein [Limosilactobacillus equigenerosi]|uniref:hypothetical protein n=1 Tax=Limosilactobacillus equigenerosi TaxID=417373 RepID=UPI0006D23D82|nr:hypothetical protein [Limosilactobacillus equigenerosi]
MLNEKEAELKELQKKINVTAVVSILILIVVRMILRYMVPIVLSDGSLNWQAIIICGIVYLAVLINIFDLGIKRFKLKREINNLK